MAAPPAEKVPAIILVLTDDDVGLVDAVFGYVARRAVLWELDVIHGNAVEDVDIVEFYAFNEDGVGEAQNGHEESNETEYGGFRFHIPEHWRLVS